MPVENAFCWDLLVEKQISLQMRKFSIIYLHKLKSNIFRATFFGITSLLLYAFLTYLHESKTTVQQKKYMFKVNKTRIITKIAKCV